MLLFVCFIVLNFVVLVEICGSMSNIMVILIVYWGFRSRRSNKD